MTQFKLFLVGLIVGTLSGKTAMAQDHFTFTSNTGNNATVAVLTSANPNISGTPLASGDEIGVSTPAGLCVGAVVWANVNTAITVWGDNDQTPAVDGILVGEQMYYRVWQKSTNTEYTNVSVTYSQGNGVYAVNGIYVLSSLTATATVPAPAAPTLASPSDGATGVSTSPTLNWHASSAATSYRLQVSTNSNFSTTVVDQSGITGTSYSVSGLANNTTYYWRVNAMNAGGTSGWSGAWNFTTVISAPSAPTLLTPANAETGVPVLTGFSWTASSGATSYGLQVSTDALFTSVVVSQTGLSGTGYTLAAPLSNSTLYYWRMNATNAGGTSSYSSTSSFTTIVAAPAAPTLASPSNAATGVSSSPTLSWNVSTGATSYQLQVSTSPTFSTTVFDQSNITSTSQQVSGLANNTLYYWRVNATNAGGTSSYSSTWSFTTIVAAPAAPTLASPSNAATSVSTSPTLSWNASTGATSYQLQVSTSPTFSTTVFDQSNITSTSQQVSGLANNTLYYWRVNATNAGGTSPYSSTSSFTTTGPTFVEQVSSEARATYYLGQNYPNPFNPSTTIEFAIPEESFVKLSVHNTLGQEVRTLVNEKKQPGFYDVTFNVSELASGIYFYRLSASSGPGQAGNFVEVRKMLLLR